MYVLPRAAENWTTGCVAQITENIYFLPFLEAEAQDQDVSRRDVFETSVLGRGWPSSPYVLTSISSLLKLLH